MSNYRMFSVPNKILTSQETAEELYRQGIIEVNPEGLDDDECDAMIEVACANADTMVPPAFRVGDAA